MLFYAFLILILLFLNYRTYKSRDHIRIKDRYYTFFNKDGTPISLDGSFTHSASIQKTDATICSNCGDYLISTDKFCTNCGNPVEIELKCINCGAIIQKHDKFCTSCGKSLKN